MASIRKTPSTSVADSEVNVVVIKSGKRAGTKIVLPEPVVNENIKINSRVQAVLDRLEVAWNNSFKFEQIKALILRLLVDELTDQERRITPAPDSPTPPPERLYDGPARQSIEGPVRQNARSTGHDSTTGPSPARSTFPREKGSISDKSEGLAEKLAQFFPTDEDDEEAPDVKIILAKKHDPESDTD